MHFKQFYLGCLAHASYLVGDQGVCAVVDPQRDVEQYLADAEARGLVITHVIETHLHADFVSGHVELARRTGATIHFGHLAGAEFDHHAVHDGDELTLGSVTLRMLETPGHTPESLCVVVTDHAVSDDPCKVLTGDTLFIGDVGRPDLMGSKGRTADEMAGLLYDSLRDKLLGLPDATEVFPAHGAGSACGRNISTALSSTIGEQKATNLMLQPMSRAEFIRAATSNLPPAPRYFAHDAELNRAGPASLADLDAPLALDVSGVAAARASGGWILDVRTAEEFGRGHVPGSINIGLGGKFASWCGQLLPVTAPLVIVAAEDSAVDEAVLRLARVGMHAVTGWLKGGFEAWQASDQPVAMLKQTEVADLKAQLDTPDDESGCLRVLDVRGVGEFEVARVPGAFNRPLPGLPDQIEDDTDTDADADLDREAPLAVICKGGYRSSTASSLLLRLGFTDVTNVVGGTDAWLAAGLAADSDVTEASPPG